jgi:hypothetical protein
MYKLLVFLKKRADEEIINLFNEHTLKHLSDLNGSEIRAADVESNLLMETKYSKFCEVSVKSRDEWDQKMNSRVGKELNKHFMNLHQFIDLIFINYPDKS